MRKYLKHFAVMAALLFAFGVTPVIAADVCTVTAAWTGPTHYAKDGICTDQTNPLDGSEAIEYTVMWRVKGTADWIAVETSVPTVTLAALPFATTIEMMVGSHYPSQAVLCYTAVSEITTVDKPASGSCSQLNLTTGF